MLVDRAEIYIRAGKGGDGCVSFRRERCVPKGGPDGGDGGDGGAVYAVAGAEVETLLDFAGRHHWIAQNGQPGAGRKQTGRNGEDLSIRLPRGTLIYDRDTGVLLKDLSELDQPVCLAEPGHGGRGNVHFARATHQTPRESEPGTPGVERWLRLELKLMADVGLVGLPNAGKSTLLSRLSHATPKIADYPFTTLRPQLGLVQLSGDRRFVIADIPGLIEGAHDGTGLGSQFLRHIERTRVIVHVVDVGDETTGTKPIDAYKTIRRELREYSETLAEKTELVVGNKTDLPGGAATAGELSEAIGQSVHPISAVAGKGLGAMLEQLWRDVQRDKQPETTEEPAAERPTPPHRNPS